MIVSSENISTRRFRFSLRTLLVGTAAVAIVIAVILAYRQAHEMQLLRQENARLRNELGEILVEPGDENKLHAVSVPTSESMVWKWRIFVPTGRKIWLYVAPGELGPTGEPPKNFGKSTLFPGEQTIQLVLRKNYHDHWEWVVNLPKNANSFGVDSEVGSKMNKLLDADEIGSTSSGVSSLTKVEPGQDLKLFRIRILPYPPNHSIDSSQLSTAGPGAEIWLSEQ